MSVVLGAGEFAYEVGNDWGNLPDGWELGDVSGVGVDRFDRVYVLTRSEHPVVIFESDGTFLGSWGEGQFTHTHGIHMAPDDTVFITDDGRHTVRQFTLEGKCLMEIGNPGHPAPAYSGLPFNQCTHTALSPDGDIYVSDGYGNGRVHKYSAAGKLLFSWGETGCMNGQFNNPHQIGCDADGWVYVADRENNRVQVFDGNGKYETQWNNMHRPCGMFTSPGRNPLTYIGEIGPRYHFNRHAPNLGPRVAIWNHKGELLAHLGVTPADGLGPGQFISPHGMSVDSKGNIYVGEVSVTAWSRLYDEPRPKHVRSLQKLVKLPTQS